MPIFVYDLTEMDRITGEHREDIRRMFIALVRMPQIQLIMNEAFRIPDTANAIILPDSDICLVRYKVDRTGIEWVTRQFEQLKAYDVSLLVRQKPFCFCPADREVPQEFAEVLFRHGIMKTAALA